MNISADKVHQLLLGYKKIYIAYSGGVDSHVLLHLLGKIFGITKGVELCAIHINHNINPKAKEWEKHCKKVCKDLGISYKSKNIDPKFKPKDHSLEEALRNARYGIFAESLPKNACLVTAHHTDDQAETLLLRLFRGAGPHGLSAMAMKIPFAKGSLIRPLLDVTRLDILTYAKKHKLKWIEDESNADTKFDRNFVRNLLLPKIKERWPGVLAALTRTANNCAESSFLLEELAASDLALVTDKNNKKCIDVRLLKKLDLKRQKNVLRFWLKQHELPMPSEVKLNEVIRSAVNSRYDASPLVKWFGAEVRRFRHSLYAMLPLRDHDRNKVYKFSKKTLKLPGDLGILRVTMDPKSKIKLQDLSVRFRRGGEKIKIDTRGTRELKKLMQEWDVPIWKRDRIPLIYHRDKIVAVLGYWVTTGLYIRVLN